jgi:hypothetical protein
VDAFPTDLPRMHLLKCRGHLYLDNPAVFLSFFYRSHQPFYCLTLTNMRNLRFLLLLLCVPLLSPAQNEGLNRLKVFIDCSNVSCDFNFIRSEITLVDFLSDQQAADVHVLITAVENGNGGKNYQLIFFGQNQYTKEQKVLAFNSEPNATSSEVRQELVKTIKFGLIPYLANSPYARLVDINMKPEERKNATSSEVRKTDPWNYWVFRVGLDGTLNTEQVYESITSSGYVTANRTTDKKRIHFGAYGSYNKYTYRYEENGSMVNYTFPNSNYQFDHSTIKSMGDHWGVGYLTSYSNSTFSNNLQRIYLKAAIEYSIFPYSEVNTRLFTISYGADVRSNKYYDTTIYYKTQEVLYGQVAQAHLSLNKKWGNVSSTLTYRNYLKDPALNNLALNVNMNVRITGGLSFYMYTSGSLVRDQVYLVKGKASEQDVLTRRRQIATDYTLYSGFGVNFRFGSKLNNFVNARLEDL